MACYRGLIRVEKIIFHGLINHIITCENRYPERKPTSTRPVSGLPVPWCYMYGVGVRVSAHLRRGAAPYADASLSLLEARAHSCLPLLVGKRLGAGGGYVEFCVRHW